MRVIGEKPGQGKMGTVCGGQEAMPPRSKAVATINASRHSMLSDGNRLLYYAVYIMRFFICSNDKRVIYESETGNWQKYGDYVSEPAYDRGSAARGKPKP